MNLQLSGYFDDEGWFGLAWIRAFEMTGEESYLFRAKSIFDDLKLRGWNSSSCGGGVQWQYSDGIMGSNGYYKNAITNELYMAMAAKLALLSPTGTQRTYFLQEAVKAWEFFNRSGLIGEQSLVNDGLCCWKYDKAVDECCKDEVCKQHMSCKSDKGMVCGNYCKESDICVSNNQTTWTYNQGVVLSALVNLWSASGESQDELLLQADAIANATISLLVRPLPASSGAPNTAVPILTEVCECSSGSPGCYQGWTQDHAAGCSMDQLPFKGIFQRHLGYFLDSVAQSARAVAILGAPNLRRYDQFLLANAESIWTRAACANVEPVGVCANVTTAGALFGLNWAGPCYGSNGSPSPPTQIAALDALTSAAVAKHTRGHWVQ
jgi:predicted alpha-1,6-mannanase (GH76 family)